MPYGDERNDASASALLVMMLVCLLILAIVGGGVFYFWVSRSRALLQAEAARREAVAAAAAAREAERRAQVQRSEASQDGSASALAKTTLVLRIAADGEVHTSNEVLAADRLQDWIAARLPSEVQLEVDPRCPFGFVLQVQTACREAGVNEITFLQLSEPPVEAQ